MSDQSKFWCFTINNPEERLGVWPEMVYRVYQKEKGENGTTHFQGFVIFQKRLRLTKLKKFNERAHWERMRGTAPQARDYCMKEDTRVEGPWEEGLPWNEVEPTVGKGKRTDLLKIKEDIDKGASLLELYNNHFEACCSNFKFFKEYKFQKEFEESKQIRPIEVILYWGVAGSGKTFKAFRNNPDAYILHKSNNGMWWPGYERQKTVIFDDFDGTWMPISSLLRLLDVYPMHVEDKGSSTPACWTKVIITSNLPIEDWYPDAYQKCPERLEALKRRIHYTIYFDKKYVPPIVVGAANQNDRTDKEALDHMRLLDTMACLDKKMCTEPDSGLNCALGIGRLGNTRLTSDQATDLTPVPDLREEEPELIPLCLDKEDESCV